MILERLKHYIATNGRVEREKLAREFALSEDGVDAMLTPWIKRGEIVKHTSTSKQGKILKIEYVIAEQGAIPLQVIL